MCSCGAGNACNLSADEHQMLGRTQASQAAPQGALLSHGRSQQAMRSCISFAGMFVFCCRDAQSACCLPGCKSSRWRPPTRIHKPTRRTPSDPAVRCLIQRYRFGLEMCAARLCRELDIRSFADVGAISNDRLLQACFSPPFVLLFAIICLLCSPLSCFSVSKMVSRLTKSI